MGDLVFGEIFELSFITKVGIVLKKKYFVSLSLYNGHYLRRCWTNIMAYHTNRLILVTSFFNFPLVWGVSQHFKYYFLIHHGEESIKVYSMNSHKTTCLQFFLKKPGYQKWFRLVLSQLFNESLREQKFDVFKFQKMTEIVNTSDGKLEEKKKWQMCLGYSQRDEET